MSNRVKLFLVSFVAFLCVACQTVVSIELLHKPSETFYKEYKINIQELAPFIDNGILFTTSIRKANHDDSWLWLGCYSLNQKSVYIKEYILQGNGIKETIPINKSCVMNTFEQRDRKTYQLYQDSIKVTVMKHNKLTKFVDENNQITVIVKYELNNADKQIEFLIDKVVIKQTVFPT